jgi:hypothetical protein
MVTQLAHCATQKSSFWLAVESGFKTQIFVAELGLTSLFFILLTFIGPCRAPTKKKDKKFLYFISCK